MADDRVKEWGEKLSLAGQMHVELELLRNKDVELTRADMMEMSQYCDINFVPGDRPQRYWLTCATESAFKKLNNETERLGDEIMEEKCQDQLNEMQHETDTTYANGTLRVDNDGDDKSSGSPDPDPSDASRLESTPIGGICERHGRLITEFFSVEKTSRTLWRDNLMRLRGINKKNILPSHKTRSCMKRRRRLDLKYGK